MFDTIYNIFGGDCSLREGELYGIEYEIESVREIDANLFSTSMCAVKEDHSLRNHGMEVVTNPITFEQALASHKDVFQGKAVRFLRREEICSERGSIHVHVNFTDWPSNKVKEFIRLYAVLEPYFFDMVAEHRHNNIYCVPLYSTHMLSRLMERSIPALVDYWHKYTAFNVKCLRQFGTIEFRHLQCTDDEQVFKLWLQTIHNLYTFVRNNDLPRQLELPYVQDAVQAIFGFLVAEETLKQKLEQQLINDILIGLNPSRDLLLSRMKQHKLLQGSACVD